VVFSCLASSFSGSSTKCSRQRREIQLGLGVSSSRRRAKESFRGLRSPLLCFTEPLTRNRYRYKPRGYISSIRLASPAPPARRLPPSSALSIYRCCCLSSFLSSSIQANSAAFPLCRVRVGEVSTAGVDGLRREGTPSETHHQQTDNESKESENGAENFDDEDLDEEGCWKGGRRVGDVSEGSSRTETTARGAMQLFKAR